MKQTLKEAVNQHVKDVQLSTEQLKALGMPKSSASKEYFLPQSWYSMSGIAALILMAVLFLPERFIDRDSGLMVDQIVMEVVENHLHQKPLEVNASQLSGIRDYFTRIDFAPIESNFVRGKNLSLIGGRYCSLQGVTAIQLRFKPVGSDGVNTLYQLAYDPKIFKSLPNLDNGEQPITVNSSGIKVTIWIEKGLLFALTEG